MSAQKKLKKAYAMLKAGKGQLAFSLFNEVLAIEPHNSEALYYLGLAAANSGRLDIAMHHFAQAIQSSPNYAAPYFEMGICYDKLNDFGKKLGFFLKAVQLEPENPKYAHALAVNARSYKANAANETFLQTLTRILHQPNIEGDKLSAVWFSLIRHSPRYAQLKLVSETTSPSIKQINQAVEDEVLIMGICYAQVRRVEFETILTSLRKTILLGNMVNEASIAFLAALALQNFHNEYIWDQSNEEQERIEELAAKVKNADLTLRELFMLAAYCPLHRITHIDNCKQLIADDPTGFGQNIWQQQVTEPQEEQNIKASITAVTPIDDSISKAVQAQYEDNPYPRWKTINYPPVTDFCRYMKKTYDFLPAEWFDVLPDSLNVLIAGCGSGRQALEFAKTFQNLEVTAIDLSLTSLAYAIRKKRELAPNAPILFAQGDILRLEEAYPPESFNIISSTGVLHHMSDPIAGWKVLTHLLKPNGLMNIALYSKTARKTVTEMRQKIAEEHLPPSAEGIRSLRQKIKSQPQSDAYHWLETLADFYSMSDCRDLLFHVQEHQFTLPQIEAALKELNLEFLGFSGSDTMLYKNFRAKFPDPHDIGDLTKWDAFEQANPQTFRGMYQFWLRKKKS